MATKDGNEIEPVSKQSNQFNYIKESSFELQKQAKLEIQIEAMNLHSTDIGKPDPFCVVNEVRKDMIGTSLVGRTEKISNTKDPKFVKPIFVSYLFEEDQTLQFSIYDFDYVGGNDLIGEVAIAVSKLVHEKGNKTEAKLQKKQRNTGTLILYVDLIPLIPPGETLSFEFSASLPKKFFNPNSYVVLEKIRTDKRELKICVSEKQKHKANPVWKFEKVSRELLHTNDDSYLKFSVYSVKTFSKEDKFVGSLEISYDQLKSGQPGYEKGFPTPAKMARSPSTEAAKVPTDANLNRRKSTVSKLDTSNDKDDYSAFLKKEKISQKIHVAIDFTASNGHHEDLDSLHAISGSGNKYVKVLRFALPGLINQYTDTHIAAYGFGAKLRDDTETSHCFPIPPYESDKIFGTEKLLEAYKSTLKSIKLSGPTVFSKVIQKVAQNVKQQKNNKIYNILLIITDGIICDREATIDSIVYASYLPMSIVIVGVGEADFTDMRRLDGDLAPLKNGRNQRMVRDIVQFVSLKRIEDNKEVAEEIEKDLTEDQLMVKAINREIPEHIIDYYSKHVKQITETKDKLYNQIQWWAYENEK